MPRIWLGEEREANISRATSSHSSAHRNSSFVPQLRPRKIWLLRQGQQRSGETPGHGHKGPRVWRHRMARSRPANRCRRRIDAHGAGTAATRPNGGRVRPGMPTSWPRRPPAVGLRAERQRSGSIFPFEFMLLRRACCCRRRPLGRKTTLWVNISL